MNAFSDVLYDNHGSRYYGWSFEKGIFGYFEHPGHLAPEKALEGKYVIQTEELDLSAVQAVEAYKDLTEIERSFRELKDLVEMRPIYHRRAQRVRAHIFVAALAFLLARALEKKLKAAGVPMSSAQALEALRTMHVVDIRVGAETALEDFSVLNGRGYRRTWSCSLSRSAVSVCPCPWS